MYNIENLSEFKTFKLAYMKLENQVTKNINCGKNDFNILYLLYVYK